MNEAEVLQGAILKEVAQRTLRSPSWIELAQKTFFSGVVLVVLFFGQQSLKKDIAGVEKDIAGVEGKLDYHVTEVNKKTDRLDNRIDRSLESLIKPAGK